MKHYRDLNARERKDAHCFMLAIFLMGVGCLISFGSALHVYTGFRVAMNAASYSPKNFWVESVTIDTRRRGGPSHVTGRIDGRTEMLGLTDLPENRQKDYDNLRGYGEERAIEKPFLVPVWYDADAYQFWSAGHNSRVLPRNYPMRNAWWIALMRLVLGNLPLVIGLLALRRWAPKYEPFERPRKRFFWRSTALPDEGDEKPKVAVAPAQRRRFRKR